MVGAASRLGIPAPDAGVAISWGAFAGSLFAVWCFWGRSLPPTKAFVVLLLVGLFPGAVYNLAVFPTSFALLTLLLAVAAAERGRLGAMSGFLIAGGLCYPSAWFAASGLGVALLGLAIGRGWQRVMIAALAAGASLGSILILAVIDHLSFGRSGAFFDFIAQAIDAQRPLDFLWSVASNTSPQQKMLGTDGGRLFAIQTGLALTIVIAAVRSALVRWRRAGTRATADVLLACSALGVVIGLILMPNSAGFTRSIVLAAPGAICLRRMPTWVLVGLAAAVGTTSALISRYFFENTMI
jgi:hypothetical protein